MILKYMTGKQKFVIGKYYHSKMNDYNKLLEELKAGNITQTIFEDTNRKRYAKRKSKEALATRDNYMV
jgi:benzoyl-CoA reductase/2-hydroxyglutaryl-CoA dehydratase subunit BcrC/BadD/HgdB